MNENLDLTKILDGCPEGTRFYSPLFGHLIFCEIRRNILFTDEHDNPLTFYPNGTYYSSYKDAECMVFPSKEQRDWDKFERFWDKKKNIFDEAKFGNHYIFDGKSDCIFLGEMKQSEECEPLSRLVAYAERKFRDEVARYIRKNNLREVISQEDGFCLAWEDEDGEEHRVHITELGDRGK